MLKERKKNSSFQQRKSHWILGCMDRHTQNVQTQTHIEIENNGTNNGIVVPTFSQFLYIGIESSSERLIKSLDQSNAWCIQLWDDIENAFVTKRKPCWIVAVALLVSSVAVSIVRLPMTHFYTHQLIMSTQRRRKWIEFCCVHFLFRFSHHHHRRHHLDAWLKTLYIRIDSSWRQGERTKQNQESSIHRCHYYCARGVNVFL